MAFDRLPVITRLNLILCGVYFVLVIVATFLIYQRERAGTMRLVLEKARSVAGEVIAEMERIKPPYYDTERSPSTPSYHDLARKQALINMIAMKEKYLLDVNSLLKRNPVFSPGEAEAQQMAWFRKAHVREIDVVTEEQGAAVLLYMRPLRMTERCLTCHGDYQTAPDNVRKLFRSDDLIFGHEEGELVGAVAVRVPMAHITAEVWETIRHDITGRSIIFLVVMVVTGLVIRKKIIAPINAQADQVAASASTSVHGLPAKAAEGSVEELIHLLNVVVKKLQDKLAEQVGAEARYRRIVDLTPVPMVTFGAGGAILYANRAAELWLGGTIEELRRRNFLTLVANSTEIQEWMMDASENGASQSFRTVVQQEDLAAPAEITIGLLDTEKRVFLARLAETAAPVGP